MLRFHKAAGFLLRRTHQISVALFEDAVRANGIDVTPVQFAALCALDAFPEIDQGTLASVIAYDRVTIGGVIDRLTAKNLVARKVSPTDRRAHQLTLTLAGAALLRRAEPVIWRLQPKILAGLDATERKQLLRLLQKLADSGNDTSRTPLRLPFPYRRAKAHGGCEN